MSLVQLLLVAKTKKMAIIGLAKNVGKTTTLNYIRAGLSHNRLGFLSIGRDGESKDLVTWRDKPAIHVSQGSLLATAAQLGEEATALLSPLQTTSITTPFGPVILYQVLKGGEVVLAGSRTLEGLQEIIQLMERFVDIILIDGAFNRRCSATPLLSDGTILATGASLSSSLSTTIKKTKDAIGILKSRTLEDKSISSILKEYRGKQGILFLYSSGKRDFYRGPSFSLQEDFFRHRINHQVEALYLSGALTATNLRFITNSLVGKREFTLILPDPTHIFVTPYQLQAFYQNGGELRVLEGINLLAITVNPTSPMGSSYPPYQFFQALSREIPEIPVFDVAAGLSTCRTEVIKGGITG